MMRAILPFRFTVEQVDGTWKLNQNKTDAARDSAAEAVRHSPIGHEVETLSALMTSGIPEMDNGSAMTYTSNDT
jgi:transcriptional regulator